jgi:Ca2+-dependent lipid-binding protein
MVSSPLTPLSLCVDSGILRFTIHECKGLEGKPNAYARVLLNGEEKLKSKPMKKNANPKWEKNVEVLVVDKTEVQMRVEVQDAANFASDVTIGTWSSSLLNIFDKIEKNDGWWDLMYKKVKVGRIRISAEWKPVIMTGLAESLGRHGFNAPAIGVVRIMVWEARDLKNVEIVTGGKSDPYVRVKSGVQVRASTDVVDNNLNPEWGSILYVPIHSIKEDLTLEVMDWNANSKDKSLGVVDMSVKELVKQCAEGEGETLQKWHESTGKKIDNWLALKSLDRTQVKGELRFAAEFYPTLALAKNASQEDKERAVQVHAEAAANEAEGRGEVSDIQAETEKMVAKIDNECPETDLHGNYIKYTPDDIVDLRSYESGVISVKIMEVQFDSPKNACAEVLVDSIIPQYRTTKLKGTSLEFNETTDAFVKEADFSRVAIQLKDGDADEKSSDVMAYWVGQVADILRRIQVRNRQLRDQNESPSAPDEGQWFPLLGTDSGNAQIRLSFDFLPILDFKLDPRESLESK